MDYFIVDILILFGLEGHHLLHHLPMNLRIFKKNSVGLGQNTKNEKSAGKPVISRFEGL